MKDLLEYIVKNLVTNPDAVVIEEENQEGNVSLYLTVDTKDMGLIIGKGGQTIHALRKILTVRAIAENVRVNLQLNEPAGGEKKEEESESSEEKSESSEDQNIGISEDQKSEEPEEDKDEKDDDEEEVEVAKAPEEAESEEK